jgi:hypothetical protein
MQSIARHWRLLTTVLSVLAGAVLGAAVQELLVSDLRLLAASAIVASAGTVGLFAALAVVVDSRQRADGEVLAAVRSLTDGFDVGVATLTGIVGRTVAGFHDGLRRVSDQLHYRIEGQLISVVNDRATLEHNPSARIILSATSQICVLDLVSPDGEWPDQAMQPDHAYRYFEALMKRWIHRRDCYTGGSLAVRGGPSVGRAR